MPKITPCLLYTKDAAKAARYYASIFKDSKIYSADSLMASFRIGGMDFLALNGPASKFTWNISFMIDCKDQKEVDHFWNKLKRGGKELRCGWVEDKFGMAWQVVPSAMPKFLGAKDRTKADRAFQAMLKMKKLDIAKLKAAFDGK
ncbi:MAG: VOC family protein [Bdellovibrionales bacterium]|nr:VOC family protein [Bdellovibrionales bacterium]